MISKIRWLWKQFTGPRISAFCVGITRVLSSIDDQLTYLNNLSISTANNSHLTLIGVLMGITRPIIEVASDDYFLFTSTSGTDADHGFSDLATPLVGGRFSDLADAEQWWQRMLMPATIFRPILLATANTQARPGSLIWLDEVCHAVNSHDEHQISFAPTNMGPGDVQVVVGSFATLGDLATMVQGAIQGIANGVLNPDIDVEAVITSSE